ncbi:MAG: ferrochelatase [Nitrospirae bacterium]|nr:ferrochelatase [Nitrospirota bacterium]
MTNLSGQITKTGILLANLGSPDEPTTAAVRRYLKEFLWDRRVVEMPRPLWWLILNGIILNTRPRRSAHAYKTVWTPEGAPLLAISKKQATALESVMRQKSEGLEVAVGMRYGSPSIRSGLEELRGKNCGRIVILPMYPQYSAATTASTFDAVADALKTWRHVPELRFITNFHDHPGYIAALAASVKTAWRNGEPDKLIISFHGMPKRCIDLGDPYHDECAATARLLAAKLGLPDGRWIMTFQSRFGRDEWLKPATDDTLRALARGGVKSVDVICPGFPADCLETLEEIAVQNRDFFHASGGERYRYIPALNDDPAFIDALGEICAGNIPHG